MKWIGQHIWDFISRFRSDVYLENLSTSSETNTLVVDSDGKITKNTAITDAEDLDVTSDSGTIDIDLNSETLTIGGTANEVETSATGTTVTVGLPNDVTVTGDLTVTGGDIVLGAADGTSSTIKRLSNASGSAGAAFYINGADAVGTNIAGGSIANFGGLGTGTGTPGAHLWYGGVKTGSGSSAQSYAANMLLSHDYTGAGVNTLRVYSSLNTSDWFAIDVAAEGATTLSTIDANTTAAHFEIAADGDITLDAAGDIALEAAGNDITVDTNTVTVTSSTADQPIIKVLNTTDDDQASQLVFEKLRDDDGVANGQNLGEIWFTGQDNGQNTQNYAYILGEIDVSTGGQESGQLALGVANHDGGMGRGLVLTGGSVDAEIDATVGLGAASVTTIAGDLTVTGSDLTFDSVALTGIQTSGESFVDDDISLMTSGAIANKIQAHYSYQYITFLADSDAVVDNQYIVPGANGISNHAWNTDSDLDYTGANATTIGHADAHITMNYLIATASIPVPQACQLAGFYAVGRNETTNGNNFGVGIFVSEVEEIDWGGTGAWDTTLRAFSLSEGTGNERRQQRIDGMLATPYALTAGDLITPAVVAPTDDQVKATITLVLRTLIA